MIASMKTAAYTRCNGREDQACMSSMTWSVIRRDGVLADTDAP